MTTVTLAMHYRYAARGALVRAARGLVSECVAVGWSRRQLPSVTDAVVVHALVQAQARREVVSIAVARDGELITMRLSERTKLDDGCSRDFELAHCV